MLSDVIKHLNKKVVFLKKIKIIKGAPEEAPAKNKPNNPKIAFPIFRIIQLIVFTIT